MPFMTESIARILDGIGRLPWDLGLELVALTHNEQRRRVVVQQGSRSFEKVDPALEAHDLQRIRNWFRALAELRLPRVAHLTFIVPCLSFDFLASNERGVRFAVHLGAELRPPFPLEQLEMVDKDWAIVFCFDPQQLAAIADATDILCTRFVVRSREP
jgi:hypothetical protein